MITILQDNCEIFSVHQVLGCIVIHHLLHSSLIISCQLLERKIVKNVPLYFLKVPLHFPLGFQNAEDVYIYCTLSHFWHFCSLIKPMMCLIMYDILIQKMHYFHSKQLQGYKICSDVPFYLVLLLDGMSILLLCHLAPQSSSLSQGKLRNN